MTHWKHDLVEVDGYPTFAPDRFYYTGDSRFSIQVLLGRWRNARDVTIIDRYTGKYNRFWIKSDFIYDSLKNFGVFVERMQWWAQPLDYTHRFEDDPKGDTKPPENVQTQYVYFVQAESGGLVKIGLSSEPERRLYQIQLSSPEPLRLLGVIKGGYEIEKNLHEKFASLRQYGEWFDPDPELFEYIEEHAEKPG